MPPAHVWFMRLLYSCSELGLGHASRTMALGKLLEQNGHEVYFFSGGKAYQLLRKEFRNVYPCTPVAWYENARGIATSASLLNILFPLPIFNYEKGAFEIKSSNAMETTHRYYDLRRHIKKIKPDLIVADGDMNALRLAHRWKFPVVYVTNLIRPSYGFSSILNPGERFTERYVKQCARIIIPDVPPPYTVCEYNLSSLDSMGIAGKVEFAGGFLDMAPVEGSEEHIFASVSGPFGTRAKLTQMVLPVLKELKVKSVVSLGLPGEKKTAHVGNCVVHTWLSSQERQECMRNARLIIFSGGHITCLETVKYAKPSVCVPTQPEQLGNAVKLQNLGCSVLARSSRQLKLAVQRIEEQKQLFKSKVETVNRFANKFNGLDRAVEVIESGIK
jgi:UDP-N-acetylglucosamine--N-acetylmuramyl-(pentapeptide) pyrophosphoryl-undecaprenol N-acetylglucosamine transferase